MKQRQKTVFAPTVQTSPQAAYFAHYENIRAHITVEDFSRVDAMIALRMRANGHSRKQCLSPSGIAPRKSGLARKSGATGKAMPKGRQIMLSAMLATGICREMRIILNCGKKLNCGRIQFTQMQRQGCGNPCPKFACRFSARLPRYNGPLRLSQHHRSKCDNSTYYKDTP